jgi:hypothetical protein
MMLLTLSLSNEVFKGDACGDLLSYVLGDIAGKIHGKDEKYVRGILNGLVVNGAHEPVLRIAVGE